MSVAAVCVDPARVREFWPIARPMIEAAMKRGGWDMGNLEGAVLEGKSHTLLWLAWDGSDVVASAVTQLEQERDAKFCTITAVGGSGKGEWMHLIGDLENYARAEGCKSMRAKGRLGWQRELPTYKVTEVVLEKRL